MRKVLSEAKMGIMPGLSIPGKLIVSKALQNRQNKLLHYIHQAQPDIISLSETHL
jgi:hypothetical protein